MPILFEEWIPLCL